MIFYTNIFGGCFNQKLTSTKDTINTNTLDQVKYIILIKRKRNDGSLLFAKIY